MKRDADFFDEHDPKLIYVARKLRDARRLEGILDAAGVDYGVEADTYLGGFIFRTERVGAFFYVRPDAEEAARRVLTGNGFTPHDGPA